MAPVSDTRAAIASARQQEEEREAVRAALKAAELENKKLKEENEQRAAAWQEKRNAVIAAFEAAKRENEQLKRENKQRAAARQEKRKDVHEDLKAARQMNALLKQQKPQRKEDAPPRDPIQVALDRKLAGDVNGMARALGGDVMWRLKRGYMNGKNGKNGKD